MTMPYWIAKIQRFLRARTKQQYALAAGTLVVVVYGLLFFIPKQVDFAYASKTCVNRLTTLPSLHASNDNTFTVSYESTWTVGSIDIASLKTCFTPKQTPTAGGQTVAAAPWGGPLFRSLYRVDIPRLPVANVAAIQPEVPATKDLQIPMSQPDAIHDYAIEINGEQADCSSQSSSLNCDIASLKLMQNASYDFELIRSFKQGKPSRIAGGEFKTLKAVGIVSGSVTSGQTVYGRPTELTFQTDKPIVAADVRLVSGEQVIPADVATNGTSVRVQLKTELPREKEYALTIASLEAKDGSGLVEPFVANFRTSGGPAVANVSVGPSGVGQSAAIVLTFDQPLSKTKDPASFVQFAGGNATVRRQSDTQLVVQLGGLPLCQPFSVTIKKGIASDVDLMASKDWAFQSRTICYQTVTYGTSLRGRALTAYVFGSSGPTTMYVGGIHGNEPSSTSLMRSWLSQLEANPARIAGKRIVVVPAINPDGLAAGTRNNSRGVNLNRNFPTDNWSRSIKDTDGPNANGGGEAPLSEPEAAALARFTTAQRPRLLLSFHAVGSLVIGDPGGYSASYANRYARAVGYRDATNSGAQSFDYNISGAYEDWTYRNAGIPSMVIELSSYTSVAASGHYSALWSMLE